MINILKSTLTFLALTIIWCSPINGQDATIKIESSLLNKLIQQTDNHLLLKSEGGSVYALDSKRNTLYPSGYVANKEEVFYVYEIGYLKQLLESSNKNLADPAGTIILETNGWPGCPPLCP